MDEAEASRYWCHMCNQRVRPIMEVEDAIKCPICQSGFVEEMATASQNDNPFAVGGSESDRALSLWAPILLGMMNNPHRRRRFRRLEFEDDDDDDDDDDDGEEEEEEEEDEEDNNESRHRHSEAEETDLDRELESTLRMRMRRRRRSSANVLQLLHGIRAGMLSGSDNSESDRREQDRDRREGERVILINPFNQTIIVQGSLDSSGNSQSLPIGSLGDYFIGPGLDLLLQHLAENDPNRHGTPPAQKEAVEALPTVKIEETLQCSVCLEDFEIGAEAKEMPCKHKFHTGCILPWLELHSSCPVCRYQLPSDESKVGPEGPRNNSNSNTTENNDGNNDDGNRREGEDGDGRNENGRRFSLPLPWPFSSLFSSSGSQSSNANSASTTSSEPSTNAPPSSHTHED